MPWMLLIWNIVNDQNSYTNYFKLAIVWLQKLNLLSEIFAEITNEAIINKCFKLSSGDKNI